jgi:hypothetical protein
MEMVNLSILKTQKRLGGGNREKNYALYIRVPYNGRMKGRYSNV